MAAAFRPRFRRGRGSSGPDGEQVADKTDQDRLDAEHAGDLDAGDRDGGEIDGGDVGHDADDADGGGEWLAYEFHEWSLESRVMLAQLLTADKVVHSWQGTTLMVHESLEEAVDNLVEEVEETEKAKEAISRPIGPEDDLTAFELGEWPETLRAELMERLVQARVPHMIDTGGDTDPEDDADSGEGSGPDVGSVGGMDPGMGMDFGQGSGDGEHRNDGDDSIEDDGFEQGEVCDLLVRAADEERVELVIDDLLAREEEASFEELEGLEVNDLLSSLFVACDRLRRDPGDPEGTRGVTTHARRLAGVRTPFGFSAPDWRNLRNAAVELLELVEGQGIGDDGVEDVRVEGEDPSADDLRELAHRMSDTLRMLV